jgi:hypothetical protein
MVVHFGDPWPSLYTWLGFMMGGHGKGVPLIALLVVIYAVDCYERLSSQLRAMSSGTCTIEGVDRNVKHCTKPRSRHT